MWITSCNNKDVTRNILEKKKDTKLKEVFDSIANKGPHAKRNKLEIHSLDAETYSSVISHMHTVALNKKFMLCLR